MLCPFTVSILFTCVLHDAGKDDYYGKGGYYGKSKGKDEYYYGKDAYYYDYYSKGSKEGGKHSKDEWYENDYGGKDKEYGSMKGKSKETTNKGKSKEEENCNCVSRV